MIRIVSEPHGLVRTFHDTPAGREQAEYTAVVVAVHTGRTVYLQDGEQPDRHADRIGAQS